MPSKVAPSAVAVIADAQPLPCAACLCGKEGGREGGREVGMEGGMEGGEEWEGRNGRDGGSNQTYHFSSSQSTFNLNLQSEPSLTTCFAKYQEGMMDWMDLLLVPSHHLHQH